MHAGARTVAARLPFGYVPLSGTGEANRRSPVGGWAKRMDRDELTSVAGRLEPITFPGLMLMVAVA
jgi:hypothetical protein